jgi:glycosyltransferase involved in cell wall biosynthesis
MSEKLNKIKVVVPFYNPGAFLDNCINSVLTQDYENYEVLFIDDMSTDGSYQKIPACTFKMNPDGTPAKNEEGHIIIEDTHPLLKKTKCKNVLAWRSSQRNTALPNIHNAVMHFSQDPDDIIVLLDGDDWLLGKGVLTYLNDFYNEHDCWVTYGSASWTDGRKCFSRPYTEQEFKYLRSTPFKVSHLRSFRAGVYHAIGKQDNDFKCFKEIKDDSWYKMTYDVAIYFPLMEVAGFNKVKHNPKPLYVYNRGNPISDDKVSQETQTRIHEEISGKKSFKQIDSYK